LLLNYAYALVAEIGEVPAKELRNIFTVVDHKMGDLSKKLLPTVNDTPTYPVFFTAVLSVFHFRERGGVPLLTYRITCVLFYV